MGIFKEFKDGFSQAVNELMPGEEPVAARRETVGNDDMVVNTLDMDLDTESEMSKLNGLLEQVTEQSPEKKNMARSQQIADLEKEFTREVRRIDARTAREERRKMNDEMMMNARANLAGVNPVNMNPVNVNPAAVKEDTTVITAGTNISGDLSSDGSIDIRGKVTGNINCEGKLIVTGVLEGNSNSAEFFADSAQVEGEVKSTGTVKIGIGSVIIGNVSATSAVIAGAIKGDIDIQGPVVVDTSAVIMGNIKSRSVQINNGAVIEGFCSQCYADVDVEGLFDEKKGMDE